MRLFTRAVLVVTTAVLGACSFIPTACTLIGCDDGLAVELANLPAGAYRVDLVLPGGDVLTRDCPEAAQCGSRVFFDGATPAEAAVRVTTARGTHETTARPAYTRSRPNGPGCEPVCRQATVTVQLPG